MQNPALLLLLAAMALPAYAAKRVTVEQLEQVLVAFHRTSDDVKVAQHIYELELTERLSEGRLAHLEADLPGPLTRQALIAVGDASAFLDLPAEDIPSLAAPDPTAQSSMLALAAEYVRETVPRLPNFYATRDLSRFEDTPIEPPLYSESRNTYEPLHQVGRSSATILYRDGSEVVRAEIAKSDKKNQSKFAEHELSTRGVFGPILSTVHADSAKGAMAWSHWEQGSTGLQAVFSYKVPQKASHYTVVFPSEGTEPVSTFGRDGAALPADEGTEKARHLPAYHGEIAVNPTDGSIMRLTMVADLNSGDPVIKADLMVEYGPVELGGKTYICPVKSVALSLDHVIYRTAISAAAAALGAPQLRVNDVLFRQYHLFRGDVRIVSGAVEAPR
jgi:hypothetical protein